MKTKINKTSIKFGFLILFSIIVLIMPILAVHTLYIKNKALWLFKSKENAYQYLQFTGVFLGVIVTVLGTFIAIERQMSKDKELQDRNILKEKELQLEILKQQKEIDIQVKLREDFIKRILETKKSIYNFSCRGLSIGMVTKNVIESDEGGEEEPPLGIEKLCIDAKKLFNDAYDLYSEKMADLITQIENYEDTIKYLTYDYGIVKEKYSTILHLYCDINFRIASFPQYTVPMMKYVNTEIKEFDGKLMELIEELTRLIKKLKKYYQTIDIPQ